MSSSWQFLVTAKKRLTHFGVPLTKDEAQEMRDRDELRDEMSEIEKIGRRHKTFAGTYYIVEPDGTGVLVSTFTERPSAEALDAISKLSNWDDRLRSDGDATFTLQAFLF